MSLPVDVLGDRIRALLRDTTMAQASLARIPAVLLARLGADVEHRAVALRDRLLALQQRASAEADSETWPFVYAISLEVDELVDECLTLVAGAAYREVDDTEAYALADALVEELLGEAWSSFCVPARNESYRLMSSSVTARFPLTFWELPVLGHEVGHLLWTREPPDVDDQLDETTMLHQLELRADATGAYVAGPAFAWACVLLSFDPVLADLPDGTHPGTTARTRAVCDGLARLTGTAALDAATAVWDAWCELVAHAGKERPDRDAGTPVSPSPLATPYEGWMEAGRLAARLENATGDRRVDGGARVVDVLNGAWRARLRKPDRARLIDADARAICELEVMGVAR